MRLEAGISSKELPKLCNFSISASLVIMLSRPTSTSFTQIVRRREEHVISRTDSAVGRQGIVEVVGAYSVPGANGGHCVGAVAKPILDQEPGLGKEFVHKFGAGE